MLDEVTHRIDEVARRTHFVQIDVPIPTIQNALPHQIRAWQSLYALVIVAEVQASEIVTACYELQRWFDELLLIQERKSSRVVDGYLLLITESAPSHNDAQQLRLNRHVCRKYLVWPATNGSRWNQLDAVAVFGLADQALIVAEPVAIEPPESIQELWKTITESTSDAEAIRQACHPLLMR